MAGNTLSPQSNIIALVWDFDKTLIPEYMEDPLFRYFKVDGKKFWDEVNHLPKFYKEQGIIHASKDTVYLNHILTYVQQGIFKQLNNALLRKLGAKIVFHKGIPEFLQFTKAYVANNPKYALCNIKLEHYIVSTGLREMIAGSKIMPYVDGVWANEFLERVAKPGYLNGKNNKESPRQISQVAYALDNTSKTRALFEINKGTNKIEHGDVNVLLPDNARRVPFTNMVYIADGPSDIPAFAVMNKYGGKTFVVYKPGSQIDCLQALALFKQKRVQIVGEANYLPGTYTHMALINFIDEIASEIVSSVNPNLQSKTGSLGHIYHGKRVYDEAFDK